MIDIAARYGGEEIAVILPETDLDNALSVAEKLREAVEKDSSLRTGLEITVSIGVSAFIPGDSAVKELIARSDAALYQAKNNGRNKVAFASENADPPQSSPF